MYKSILLLVTLFFLSSLMQAQTTVRITNGEWDPYLSSQAYEYGLTSHIITQAFKLEGIDIEWGFFPWKRAFENAKEGHQWDASAAWSPNELYLRDFLLSDTIMNIEYVFFHLKEFEFDWTNMDDLQDINIGITRGYNYGKPFMNARHNNKIYTELANTDEQNFSKLLFGRIKIFPNDKLVGYTQIKNTFSPLETSLFTHHPNNIKLKANTLHLLISKNSKNAKMFLEKFNAGLKTLRGSPQYQQMFMDLEQGKYQRQETRWHK